MARGSKGKEFRIKRLHLFALVFSIAFAVFLMGLPPLLSRQFGIYPLMKTDNIIDILTPLVLIPLYGLLYWIGGNKAPSWKENLAFLVLVAFWVEGQGMHLSADSIGNFLKGMVGSDAYNLAHFYDEVLSHYLWHFGVVGLSALLISREWHSQSTEGRAAPWLLSIAGVIYGFTYFLIVIEGATTPLGVPFAVLALLFALVWGRRKLEQRPLLLFFSVAYLVATLCFAGWGVYWRGFPEFSQVGIFGCH